MMNKSLELDDDGDIIIDVVDGVKRARLTIGPEEIEQAYRIRFETRRGEDELFPQAGLPIDDLIGLFNADFIAGKARETLLQDPRTLSVGTVEVELDSFNRVANLTASCKLSNGETVASNLTVTV